LALQLRRATEADLSVLVPMMVDFNRLEAIPWTYAKGEAALRQLLGQSELGFIGLAQAEGAACGYFVVTFGYDLEWNGRDAFLTELYLVPEARGRGLGRQLLLEAETEAEARGVRALHLVVRPENAAALALYLRTGFRETERRLLSKPLGLQAKAPGRPSNSG
jgi:ribosomal protein S18 acetylase RimI-like enzyme